MKLRKKTNLDEAVVTSQYTGELWLHVAYSLPIYEGQPQERIDDHRQFVDWELDMAIGWAITDALQAGWVVLPPVQSRVQHRFGQFPESEREYHERRVRVARPYERTHWAGVRAGQVAFALEPSRDLPAWETYKPEYEETAEGG
ncbi:MAG TPA: hypothetical protein VFX15_03030 [Actinomycetes bacterium]|nr:hypothetical protein [Actinomycetes bacterium]